MNRVSEESATNMLVDMSGDLLCILNHDLRFIQQNNSFEKIFNKKLSALKSLSILDLIQEEDKKATYLNFQKLLTGEETEVSFAAKISGINGSIKCLSWNAKMKEGSDNIYLVAKEENGLPGIESEAISTNLHLQYETVLNTAEQIIVATDSSGKIMSFNRAGTKLLGYQPQELINQYTLAHFHSKVELDVAREKIKTAQNKSFLSEEEFFQYFLGESTLISGTSWNFVRKDGSHFPVQLAIQPIIDDAGNSSGFIAIASDISLHQKITDLAKEKEQQLIAFIQHAPTAIALFDMDMRYLRASNCWLKENLKDTREYVGLQHNDFHTESPWTKYYHKAVGGEIVKDDDYCITRPNGNKEWISWELRPWLKADATIGGVIVTTENITFRKVAHAAVTAKSQMLNGILRNLPVIIYKMNAEGVFTECIGAGLRQMGIADNEVVGTHAKLLFSTLTNPADLLSDGHHNIFRTNGNLNGQEWHFENYLFPDNVNNKGIIGFAFDISDKVIKEREMQTARDRAETADKYKSQFLASMSHEIRTPLNAIIGFAEIFERRNLTTEQKSHLHNINSSGNLLLKLIGDILDLSKIEEGKLSLDEESFNIKEVLTSDLLPYKYNANKKGLDFHLKLSEELPAYIIADPNKIKQIVINLIGNALKFTKAGSITIDVKVESQSPNGDEALIKFSVGDTGMGIPVDKQKSIFESFTQADSSINKEYGGSGLGLNIVQKLVELMGGKINVTSPVNSSKIGGAGSVFWFVLQCKVDQNKSLVNLHEEKISIEPFTDPINVLVAEDNLMNQALAEIILKRLNCKVIFAENGEEAVELFIKHDFDLILMDVQMPVMNGFQATEIIRKSYKSAIPIIGLTANVYKEDISKCMQVGMDDYLGKPYTEAQLFKIIKTWSARKQHKKEYTNLQFLENSCNGNEDFVKSMIQIFFKENEEFLQNLEASVAKKDVSLLKQSTHKAKSCYKMVGINSADVLFKGLEENFSANDWNLLKDICDKFKFLSQLAVKELEENL